MIWQIWVLRTVRALALMAAAMAFGNTPAVAQSCELPSSFARLSVSLTNLPRETGPISLSRASQISEFLSQIDDQTMVAQLRDNGLKGLSRIVADVMSEADRIATSGEIADGRKLTLLLRDLNQQTLIACAHSGADVFKQIEDDSRGSFPALKDMDWDAANRILTESQNARMGVLVFLVGAVVAVLYLFDSLFRLLMALKYNRKACRIPAVLRVGTETIDATIITLGRGGCRMLPADPDEFDEQLARMRQAPTLFEIGGYVIEANISAIYEEVSDFRFTQNIHLRAQKELLQLSTISPYYVKKTKKKPPPQEKPVPL